MESPLLCRSSQRVISLCCLVLAFLLPASGQYHVSPSLFKPENVPQSSPLRILPDTLRIDSAKGSGLALKSPATAVILSAVVPGAGQIYTGRYWKVPIILGFAGYFAWEWVRMNDDYTSVPFTLPGICGRGPEQWSRGCPTSVRARLLS